MPVGAARCSTMLPRFRRPMEASVSNPHYPSICVDDFEAAIEKFDEAVEYAHDGLGGAGRSRMVSANRDGSDRAGKDVESALSTPSLTATWIADRDYGAHAASGFQAVMDGEHVDPIATLQAASSRTDTIQRQSTWTETANRF
jgi:hypothetical protein